MFTPKHLSAEQLAQLYGDALAQTEAQVANAWINLTLAPQDPVRQAAYDEAGKRLRELETDRERVLGARGRAETAETAGRENGALKCAEDLVAARAPRD